MWYDTVFLVVFSRDYVKHKLFQFDRFVFNKSS